MQLDWEQLSKAAWQCRESAFILGKTKVGAAVLASSGKIYVGCNVEHRFRSHDIHAEVNAISSMVANNDTELKAIIIAAERDRFTPCGSCMDWIFQFGGPECIVAYQTSKAGQIFSFKAEELMPYYPH
jgi:cytidine deaminase